MSETSIGSDKLGATGAQLRRPTQAVEAQDGTSLDLLRAPAHQDSYLQKTATLSKRSYSLAEHTFVKLLPEERAQELLAAAEILRIRDGEALFKDGQLFQGFYLVLSGEIAISKVVSPGRSVQLLMIRAGEQVGDFGLFPREVRTATATAVGEVEVARISSHVATRCVWGDCAKAGRYILEPIITRIGIAANHGLRAQSQERMNALDKHLADVGAQLRSTCHDMRNAQQIIGMAAEVIHDTAGGRDDIRDSAMAISSQVVSISELLDRTLRYAKQGLAGAPSKSDSSGAVSPSPSCASAPEIDDSEKAPEVSKAISLQHHPLIRQFPKRQAAQLVQAAEIVPLQRGAVLFEEGEPPDSLYLVLSGEIEITKKAPNDLAERILVVDKGGHFGDFGVLDCGIRSATASAHTNTLLARIPADVLTTVLWGDGISAGKYLVGPTIARIRLATEKTVKERVEAKIAEHSQRLVSLGLEFKSTCYEIRRSQALVRAHAESIRAISSEDPEIAGFIQMIMTQIDWMHNLTEKTARFADGEDLLRYGPVSVCHLLSTFQRLHVLDAYQGLHRDVHSLSHVTLTIKPVEKSIYADEEQILRVLQNLAVNAAQAFTRQQGHIHIEAKDQGEFVLLTVTDDGPGLPESIRAHPFRAYHSEGKAGGTGLGMASAKEIVEAHGGVLAFSTAPGKGTTFSIRLPAMPANCQ